MPAEYDGRHHWHQTLITLAARAARHLSVESSATGNLRIRLVLGDRCPLHSLPPVRGFDCKRAVFACRMIFHVDPWVHMNTAYLLIYTRLWAMVLASGDANDSPS